MIEFLWTMICIFIVLGTLFLIGLPIACLLTPEKNQEEETTWIIAPFLGLATIALVSQNLIYLNLTLKQSSLILWLITGILWAWLFKRHRVRPLISSMPSLLLITALIIYLIQGIGLLILGVDTYIGRGWHDQLNYTLTAQALMDYPFHQATQDLIQHPSVIKGIGIAGMDRIGAMLYQGFLASTLFTSAKTAFEPAILTISFLTVLAIYQLAQRLSLSKTSSLLTAAIAGSLPSLAAIHLECFFSQALAVPLLLFWPIVLSHLFTSRSWQSLVIAALFLAAITSIYTEFYLIFVAVSCLAALFEAIKGIIKKKRQFLSILLLLIAMIVIALALNPGYFDGFYNIIKRGSSANFLSGLYPWARKLEGWGRLWFGDFAGKKHYAIFYFISSVSTIILILLAYLGLGLNALKQKRNWIALACLVLALLPLGICLLGSRKYEYQFYKLLLTISPLLPLGVILFLQSLNRFIPPFIYWTTLLITSSSTLYMGWQSTNIKAQIHINRGGAFKLLPPETLEIQNKLRTAPKQNILINWKDDFFNGNFVNGWLNYFARDHAVWLTNTQVGDSDLAPLVAKLDTLPNTFWLLTATAQRNLIAGSAAQEFWKNKHYSLWEVKGKNWALLYFPNALNQSPIHILAGEPGIVTLKITAPAKSALMTTNHHFSKIDHFNAVQEITAQFPVQKGITLLNIQLLRNNPYLSQEQGNIELKTFSFKRST